MRKELLVILCFLGNLGVAQKMSNSSIELGEQWSFYSTHLKQQRKLNVYLPANYRNDTNKTFPVIYLLDGSMDEDFIHISGLVQFQSFPWINKVPEAIVVGIANVDRKHDFTDVSSDTQDLEELPTSGGSSQFIHFLEEEVLPSFD